MTTGKREEEILKQVLEDEIDAREREFRQRMTGIVREIANLQRQRAMLDDQIKNQQKALRELTLTPFNAAEIIGK